LWRERKAEGFTFRQAINFGNELAAAVALLDHVRNLKTLRYEPRIPKIRKTFDFLLMNARGHQVWIDVKTVAPRWVDDEAGWRAFQAVVRECPPNARLVVNRVWSGAAIANQALKARYSFVVRTLEVEEKLALIPQGERNQVWLMLCGDRSAWYPDDLEDFADHYRTRGFREDDWAQNAVARYMRDRHQRFSGALAGFRYLGRRHDELAIDARFMIRGPWAFSPAN
jgi:hypothetical protein